MTSFYNYIIFLLLISGQTLVAQHKNITSLSFSMWHPIMDYNTYSQKTSTLSIDTIKPASFAMSCYTTSPSTALVLYYADVKVPHDSGLCYRH